MVEDKKLEGAVAADARGPAKCRLREVVFHHMLASDQKINRVLHVNQQLLS
jgi:hypothetical protein